MQSQLTFSFKAKRSNRTHTVLSQVQSNAAVPKSRATAILSSPVASRSASLSAKGAYGGLARLHSANYKSTRGAKNFKVNAGLIADDADAIYDTKLSDLELIPFINEKGRVMPGVVTRSATVFAVFDENEDIQYIGFSKDIRNTLRALLGRKPDVCHSFKVLDMVQVDQKKMLNLRQNWIKEVGSPPGLKKENAMAWQKPVKCKNRAEAEAKADQLRELLKARGLIEDFPPDVTLLDKGEFDIAPSQAQTDEQLDAEEAMRERIANNTREIKMNVQDKEVVFTIFFRDEVKTNGGYMYDVNVLIDEKETSHRVIVGDIWPEAVGISSQQVVERCFAFLLNMRAKIGRRTEGLLASNQFPINYFAMSEVLQWYPEFQDMFDQPCPGGFWRFDKNHTYNVEAAADTNTGGIPLLGPEDSYDYDSDTPVDLSEAA